MTKDEGTEVASERVSRLRGGEKVTNKRTKIVEIRQRSQGSKW